MPPPLERPPLLHAGSEAATGQGVSRVRIRKHTERSGTVQGIKNGLSPERAGQGFAAVWGGAGPARAGGHCPRASGGHLWAPRGPLMGCVCCLNPCPGGRDHLERPFGVHRAG